MLATFASQLKSLSADDLYATFHEIQFQTLSPQWNAYLNSLLGKEKKIKEIAYPRLPEVPETFLDEVLNQIHQRNNSDVLFFNCGLSCVREPLLALKLADNVGFTQIVIHDVPRDGTFSYDSYPSVKYFTTRNQKRKTDPYESSGNKIFTQAVNWCPLDHWNVRSDSYLDFLYETDSEKLALCRMELALDLIYSKFRGDPTIFDQLQSELETWYRHPGSAVKVMGTSRWLILKKN